MQHHLQNLTHTKENNLSLQQIVTPWKSIFTSTPFYALLITHCGENWGFWTLLTEIPSYMSSVLKFDIESVSN